MSGTGQARPWPYDGPEGRARLTGNLGTEQAPAAGPQMCTIDDLIEGDPPCRRVAQHVWYPLAGDHPVYLCNFHAEPFGPFETPGSTP